MAGNRFDVIVVGGGMVGAALAAQLDQAGLLVALVEARQPLPFDPDSEYDLRVSAISAASQRLLERISAWGDVQAQRHCQYSTMRIWEQDSTQELKFAASDIGRDSLGCIVENSLIVASLWRQFRYVTLFCPGQISALTINDAEAEVTLSDGKVLTAPLVVAADGAASKTRELAGMTTFGRAYQQQGIVSVVKTRLDHASTAWQRFTPDGPLAFLPLQDGHCSIVWSVNDDRADELLQLDSTTFCQQLTDASQGRLGEIMATGPRAAFPLQMRQAEQFVQPRLALVGDAAHVVHPLAGQGVNLGFGDVSCLTSILIEAKQRKRDFGSYKLLRRYERERKSEDALMAQMTDGLSRLYGSEQALLKAGRREGVRAVNMLKPLKAAFIRHAVGR